MKQPSLFIALMLSLFIFQSLWNVAAAFCVHERLDANSTVLAHFGHHGALPCEQNKTAQHSHVPALQEKNQLLSVLSADDHRDHLPSFAHFMLIDVQQSANQTLFSAYLPRIEFDWRNLYQSPHLYQSNPPPVFAPL